MAGMIVWEAVGTRPGVSRHIGIWPPAILISVAERRGAPGAWTVYCQETGRACRMRAERLCRGPFEIRPDSAKPPFILRLPARGGRGPDFMTQVRMDRRMVIRCTPG